MCTLLLFVLCYCLPCKCSLLRNFPASPHWIIPQVEETLEREKGAEVVRSDQRSRLPPRNQVAVEVVAKTTKSILYATAAGGEELCDLVAAGPNVRLVVLLEGSSGVERIVWARTACQIVAVKLQSTALPNSRRCRV